MMKSFSQFLFETTASQQALRLGLVGDNHGGWYDKSTGEFVAKTEKGRLRFYNKRQVIGGQDPAQTEQERNISNPSFQDPALEPQQQQAVQQQPVTQTQVELNPELAAGPPPVPKTKGTLTVSFGRFNPPHLGHLQLMDTAAAAAQQDGGDYLIVPSRTQDKKKKSIRC